MYKDKVKKNALEKNDIYQVEEIIGKRKFAGVDQYQVKWLGYNEVTWEPLENLENVKDLIEIYENNIKQKNNKNSRLSNKKNSEKENKKEIEKEKENEAKYTSKKRNRQTISDQENSEENSSYSEGDSFKKSAKKQKNEISQSATLPVSPEKISRSKKLSGAETAVLSPNNIKSKKEKQISPPISPNSINHSTKLKSPMSPINTNIYDTISNMGKGKTNSTTKSIFKPPIEEGKLGVDKPMKIVTGKQHEDDDNLILCEVEWYPRKEGIKPRNSYYTNKDLKELNPHLLCEFYEERLKFPSKKKNL